jgi:hypothetical protein
MSTAGYGRDARRGHANMNAHSSLEDFEVCCDSCSVKSYAALGVAYPLSLAFPFLIFR